eukprot:CAMPEP_0204525436 /NCGR_PEP_ID=MMETSP0661-20131031/7907_1 /ASSEMBLY_ACC=CAM_ASM_000606 /TAXON_ID=109239 /ORGANISM="Alexandrium margalefi, Strain AMGDE01CS-322" /LENGTH=123 /DNA_ID=CAMNT_0051531235 /DNA_START=87 /DNA_END=455 /DNA_ORIENTATION=+
MATARAPPGGANSMASAKYAHRVPCRALGPQPLRLPAATVEVPRWCQLHGVHHVARAILAQGARELAVEAAVVAGRLHARTQLATLHGAPDDDLVPGARDLLRVLPLVGCLLPSPVRVLPSAA